MIDGANPLGVVLALIPTIDGWLKYCFADGPAAPGTPSVRMEVVGEWMVFRASVDSESARIGAGAEQRAVRGASATPGPEPQATPLRPGRKRPTVSAAM